MIIYYRYSDSSILAWFHVQALAGDVEPVQTLLAKALTCTLHITV